MSRFKSIFYKLFLLSFFNIFLLFSLNAEAKTDTDCMKHPAMVEVNKTVEQILKELEGVKSQIKKDPKVVYPIIDKLLVPKADFEVMSQLVLTRNWRGLSNDQKQDFTKEFSKLMIRTYGVAFESYDGETVDYSCPVRNLPGKRDRVEVSTTIHSINRPDSVIKFRILERNNICKQCKDDIKSCKSLGSSCKKMKAGKEFDECKVSYNKCKEDVKVCSDACDKCNTCDEKGSDAVKDFDCNSCNFEWLVYDLIIDNISIIDSYRQIFADKFRKTKDANKIIAEMHGNLLLLLSLLTCVLNSPVKNLLIIQLLVFFTTNSATAP